MYATIWINKKFDDDIFRFRPAQRNGIEWRRGEQRFGAGVEFVCLYNVRIAGLKLMKELSGAVVKSVIEFFASEFLFDFERRFDSSFVFKCRREFPRLNHRPRGITKFWVRRGRNFDGANLALLIHHSNDGRITGIAI